MLIVNDNEVHAVGKLDDIISDVEVALIAMSEATREIDPNLTVDTFADIARFMKGYASGMNKDLDHEKCVDLGIKEMEKR